MSLRPTWPGFGFTTAPERGRFNYSFDNLAKVVQAFTAAIGLDRYAIYVFDYGAPIGFPAGARLPGTRHCHHLAERQRLFFACGSE